MATLAHIFRHPIKGIGSEEISQADLTEGRTMPWDRVWAVAHEAAKLPETPDWTRCANFVRGAKSARLMAISAQVDEASGQVTLSHPDQDGVTLNPDTDGAALLDWVKPLCNPDRALPVKVYKARDRGLTDSAFPSISILGTASLTALSQKAGRTLEMERFRGNIWLDGLSPWQEFEWIGRTLRIGGAEITIRERIERCVATKVDPATGRPDTDTLALLQDGWNHIDFGVYGEVTKSGAIATGDSATLL